MAYEAGDIVIVAGCRTPIGNLNGCLSSLAAHELGAVVIRRLIESCDVDPTSVSEVIMGQVLTAGQGQNPVRQASMEAGLPHSVPAHGISMVCGSGLMAVANACQAVRSGDSHLVIAGGQESMSKSHHSLHMRSGLKFGAASLEDSMINDGLTDAFHKYHMGITAENVAEQFGISREEQDEFAVRSQQKISLAQEMKHFNEEIVPVHVSIGKEPKQITSDEFPRNSTTTSSLARLRPCFKDGGTVTAGNSSGLNDGAAAVLIGRFGVMTREPMARIVAWAQAGVAPDVMGTGPIPAVRKALEKAQWSIADVDLFELNEAFAAQSIAVIKELGIEDDKLNVCGGAIGLGHPIGASGCRILVTLLHAMKRLSKRRGVAALCIGGGMGIAMCVERL